MICANIVSDYGAKQDSRIGVPFSCSRNACPTRENSRQIISREFYYEHLNWLLIWTNRVCSTINNISGDMAAVSRFLHCDVSAHRMHRNSENKCGRCAILLPLTRTAQEGGGGYGWLWLCIEVQKWMEILRRTLLVIWITEQRIFLKAPGIYIIKRLLDDFRDIQNY